jgi:hypothetical protein
MTGPASDVLRLDRIITAGIDGDPYEWLVAYGQAQPTRIIAPYVPDWVRLGLLQALAGFYRGQSRLCIHRPNRFDHRQPIVAASVRPNVIVCADGCELTMLHRPQEDDAWATCALCGGPAATVASTMFGRMNYRTPVCDGCRP